MKITHRTIRALSYEGLELFVYHQPKEIDGQLCKFSLKHFRTYFGKSAEMIKEEMLPTTDHQIAEKMFKEKGVALLKIAAIIFITTYGRECRPSD